MAVVVVPALGGGVIGFLLAPRIGPPVTAPEAGLLAFSGIESGDLKLPVKTVFVLLRT